MESRHQQSYQQSLYDFIKEDIFVVCPACSKKAIVKTGAFDFTAKDSEAKIRLVCPSCGHSKQLLETPDTLLMNRSHKPPLRGRVYAFGGSVDPFFRLPLWLNQTCGDELLWAYNYTHLDALEQHVAAKLRERNGQTQAHKNLGARLPRWMTSAKNRELVLKTIAALRLKQ